MYNTYVSSTLSLGCNGSLSFSFNDCSYLNDRFDRNPIPLSSQSCCSCCANSQYRCPISPSFSYGLGQSALIQWSGTRRLILGGGDRYYHRFPVHETGWSSCCCGYVSPLKVRSVSGRRGRWEEGRFKGMVSEEKRKRHHSHCVDDDVEVILSLLTEVVGEECFLFRERSGSSSRRVEVEKGSNGGRTSYSSKKKNVGSGLLESNSKSEVASVRIQLREEDCRQKENKENCLRGEKRRARKEGSRSSCSSYYSCSSLGEFEGDVEVQARQEGYGGELTSGFKRDSVKSGEATYEGEIEEDVKRQGVVMQQEKIPVGLYAASSGVECDWRKATEKKLADESIEQTESREESLQKHTRLSEVHESGYRKDFSSQRKFDEKEEKSTLRVSIDGGTRQRYSQRSDQIAGQSESRVEYKHSTGMQEIRSSDIEAISSSDDKHFSGKEANISAEGLVRETRHEHAKTAGPISRKDDYRRNSQQLSEVSEIQGINVKGTYSSQGQSKSSLKNIDNKSTLILSSVQDMQEQAHLTSQLDSRQMEYRRKQLTEVSDMHEIDIDNTSASLRQSDSSFVDANRQQFQTGQKAIRRTESRKGSQDVSSAVLDHSSDAQVTNTQRQSEKTMSSQETYSTLMVKSTKETAERHNQTDERVVQIGSRKEAQRPTKALSFSEETSKEASSSRASLILKTQPTVQQIGVLHVEPSYIISHEDALGSADRLQKSSMHFVGEFVEKMTHEVSSSEIQKESRISETELVNEGHKHQEKSSSHYGSGDFKSRESDSWRSSRNSGVKGPSDEIWNVTDSSVQEPVETEVPERNSPATNTVAKRTGRSMWNIIVDIVRLRWASSSESHNSTLKLGGKSSPNQSVSSEAWFSGHEQDENNDENVKREKKSKSQDSKSSDQQNPVTIPTQSQGEGSSSISSKDEIVPVGGNTQSFSSGSASKGISSVCEENLGRNETRKNHVSTSDDAIVEPPVLMPSLHIRRSPRVDEIPEDGKTDVSGSGSSVQKEQLIGAGLTEVSGTEGKGGELKHRKLQRTNQVMKDRFDEWEEAYKLESEQRKIDEIFMREALLEAKKAGDIWEVPVGAVLVQHGKIIARGCNLVEELRDSTAHAEMICIREASNVLRTWRLAETTLYVTLEPCAMCAGAILQARVDTVVWGAPNKLLGADGSWIRLFPIGSEGGNGSESTDKLPAPVHPFHPKITIRRGVLAAECADIMQQFFQLRRREKDKKPDSSTERSHLPISHHPSKFFTKMHDAFRIMFCL
ncbi:hypothetical protein CsSME_00022291 [Camellia sinensis var. sinensis]